MKSEIKVPAMGESITEATVGSILVPSGNVVKVDQEILELETDKVNQLLYAPQAGTIHLTVQSGEGVKIGQVIGTIESETQAAMPTVPPSPVETAAPLSTPKGQPSEKSDVRQMKEQWIAQLQQQPEKERSESQPQPSEPKMEKAEQVPPIHKEREIRHRMSNIRRVIAKRLVEVHQTTAMLTTFNEIDLSQVIHLREKYKESFTKKYEVKLGFMSFFVKASISALQAFPNVNAFIDGEDIVYREYYNIGIAVGTERGLIVPVVRNCDQLSFAEIELSIENFAKKAREGTLNVEDLQGGGFTITNGGVYGSLLSTPILNPPQSGILGMHKIEKRPIASDDQVVIRPMMYVALSYDHRVIDGREAVLFLVHIKNTLEDPSRLLLDI